MAEHVTDAEKVKICQHLLLNSPPGQFSDVLAGKLTMLFMILAEMVIQRPNTSCYALESSVLFSKWPASRFMAPQIFLVCWRENRPRSASNAHRV